MMVGWKAVVILMFAQFVRVVVTQNCSFKIGETLPQPDILNNTASKWRVTLRAEKGNLTVDWLSLERRTYNKMIPAPTIMVKQGDKLEILLENNLDNADKDGVLNEERFPDSTNLHLHGLHIDSKVPGDNVLIRIKPGQRYLYSYTIENDQPTGTYWYHPHLHGSTIIQVNSGMAGMLIVQDSESVISDQLKAVTCPFNCQHDIQLVFQSTLLYTKDSADPFVSIQNKYDDTVREITTNTTKTECLTIATEPWLTDSSGLNDFTTNGKLKPTLRIKTGEMKRFRMVNAGGSPILEVEMVNTATRNYDCEYLEIALDGVYLNEPRAPRQNKTLIVPGGRADWLVRCNTPGTYEVRSMALDVDRNSTGTATRRFNGTLLTVIVEEPATTGSIGNVALPQRPSYVNFETRTDLNTSFSIEIGPQLTLNREKFAGEHYFRHLVTEVNQLVQWNFLNAMPTEGHPIHIHVNHFKIVDYEEYTGPVGQTIKSNATFPNQPWLMFSQDTSLDNRVCHFQHEQYNESYSDEKPGANTLLSYPHEEVWDKDVAGTVGYSRPGDYRDTLMVPPLSNITIQFMVHKFTDIVVIHCHFLRHEDFGMMLLVDIIDPMEGGKTDVNPESGNALPGQCNGSPTKRNNRLWYVMLCYFTILVHLSLN